MIRDVAVADAHQIAKVASEVLCDREKYQRGKPNGAEVEPHLLLNSHCQFGVE